MDKELFKKLDDTDIWELRTLFNGICYRLLSFWDNDEGALVIVTHGIIKKTQKTPSKEIAKAEAIMKEYCELLTPKGMSFGDTNISSLFLLLPIIAF